MEHIKITSNNFADICENLSNIIEKEINAFDEHLTFDEERQKVFRLGILHATSMLGNAYAYKTPITFDTDYENFIKKYEAYQKEQSDKKEKAHQISMEEYLEEKDKENNIEDLAEKVAEIILKKLNKKGK